MVMTDQIDPQFEIFSEMLDHEESLGDSEISLMGKDGAVLMDLRQHLRGHGSTPPLPEDFAKTTADVVQERLANQSLGMRALISSEPILRARPLSATGIPWVFAGSLLGVGAAAISWKAVALLGAVVLILGLSSNLLLRSYLPETLALPDAWSDEGASRLSRLFYAVPVLSALMTSLVGGLAVAGLGEVSLSFQSNSANLKLAGAAGALVMAAWLVNALWPVWRAYEEATRGRRLRTMFIQSLHALWLWVMLFALLESTSPPGPLRLLKTGWWPEWLFLGCLAMAFAATWALSGRRVSGPRQHSLWTGLKRGFVGLLVGIVPIVITFVVFYQASLTRQLTAQPQYEQMTAFAQDWLSQQKAIAPEDNGMTELRPILFARPNDPGVTRSSLDICARMKKGYEVLARYEYEDPETFTKPEKMIQWHSDKLEFLKEIPRIKAAVSKPYLSYRTNGELSLENRAPNFIICRGVSQGLEGLTRESLDNKDDLDQALDLVSLNLRWASRFRQGVLIDHMIGLGLDKIALSSVERIIFESHPNRAQLERLGGVLAETTPLQSAFRDSMFLEAYSMDSGLQQMADGNDRLFNEFTGNRESALLRRLVPRSYWESERKIMMNLQLSQTANWAELGPISNDELEDALQAVPWSIGSSLLPNLSRAQVQFMHVLSRTTALRLEVALELYKLDNGTYPESLNGLVPEYIESVSVDAMHPNLWKHKKPFAYTRKGDGYRLVSESELYKKINLKSTTWTYGPDSDYKFEL